VKRRRRLGILSAAAVLAAFGVAAAPDTLYPFSEPEIQQIVAHGP